MSTPNENFELLDLTSGIDYQAIVVDGDNKPILDDAKEVQLKDAHISKPELFEIFDNMSVSEDDRNEASKEVTAGNLSLSQVMVGIAIECADMPDADVRIAFSKKEQDIPKCAAMFGEVISELCEQAKKEGHVPPNAVRQRKSDIRRALVHGVDVHNKACSKIKAEGLKAMNTDGNGKGTTVKSALELLSKAVAECIKAEKQEDIAEGHADRYSQSVINSVNDMTASLLEQLASDKETFASQDVASTDVRTTVEGNTAIAA